MDKVALILGDTLIYWSSVVIALAVLTGVVFFLAACLLKSAEMTGAILACPLAIALSLLLGRLVHWYFRADSYESFAAAMTDFSGTEYALIGAFAGSLLAAGILRLVKAVGNLPRLLDCMSIGGCAAIALGRLSGFFTTQDRGEILDGVTNLPWVFPVVNSASGLPEYRFATFFFQAIAAGCIWGLLLLLSRKKRRDGDIALMFLLLYSASQIVLDSTRYDSLRLRSNGFISIVQLLCALTLVLVVAVFATRLKRKTGWKPGHVAVCLITAAAMGGAGYMEYYVQRHGNQAAFAYLVMGGCLCAVVLLGILLWHLTNRETCQAEEA